MSVEKYYNSISEGYGNLYEEEQKQKIETILNIVDIKGKVLDVGCGTCLLANYIEDYTGVDVSSKFVEHCKKKGLNVIKADAKNLPFKNKEFDWVVSITVLQDVDEIEKAVKEMKRVGKKLCISVLKKGNVRKVRELLRGAKEYDIGKDILFIK